MGSCDIDAAVTRGHDVMWRRWVFFLVLCTGIGSAMAASLDQLRVGKAGSGTRLVFDLSDTVQHKVFTLAGPDRLVIDLSQTRLRASLPKVADSNPLIKNVRSGTRKGHDLRVVVDLKTAVRPRSFFLKADASYDYPRLVVDIHDRNVADAAQVPVIKKAAEDIKQRNIVIAIDAGHGGNDPGARGGRGTQEKYVVLDVARRLKTIIDGESGMEAVLTRDGDYYLGLRERMAKAREAKADLFISIHADAFRDSRVRGSSVYTLSERGASSEAARWLAEQENGKELGGVSLEDKDKTLASVLMDLSQSATTEASMDVANQVLRSLKKVGKTHKPTVQQAGFVVLKSPDIPSILVETAFISNPSEESRLRTPKHQQKMAEAIFRGVRGHFRKSPPPGTRWAMRTHVIENGDTLSHLATRYHISVAEIRDINGLTSDRIRTGQKIRIPGS